jgi:hypothetical protein
MPLSLEEQYRVADIVTLSARLYALDRVRTEYLQRAEQPIPERDVTVLSELTDAMGGLLQEAPKHAIHLRRVIVEHSGELRETYERVVWREDQREAQEDLFVGDQRERFQDIVARHGGISEYGVTNVQGVMERAHIERGMLEAEMNTIRRGGFAAGDLGEEFLCNIAAMCIVGGLFAPPPMNIVGVGVGLATLGGIYASGGNCA